MCTQLIGDFNLPRSPRRYLFSGDETIIQPPMNRGSVNTEDLCCLANRHDLPGVLLCCRFVARNVAISTQAANLIRREAFTACCFPSLTIENASDDIVRVVGGQTTK